jgi:hypothetical protein
MQNKANFRRAKMNAKGFSKRDYENKPAFGVQENKPKQSQFSNRKTDDRRQKPALSKAEGTVLGPPSSALGPLSSGLAHCPDVASFQNRQ